MPGWESPSLARAMAMHSGLRASQKHLPPSSSKAPRPLEISLPISPRICAHGSRIAGFRRASLLAPFMRLFGEGQLDNHSLRTIVPVTATFSPEPPDPFPATGDSVLESKG